MFRTRNTPPFSYILDGLRTRNPLSIAKHLDVSPRSLARWTAADAAPRAVMLALFYETNWGFSVLDTTAHNEAMYARAQVQGLERECAMLRGRIARLEALGGFGSANEPYASAVAVRTPTGPALARGDVFRNEVAHGREFA